MVLRRGTIRGDVAAVTTSYIVASPARNKKKNNNKKTKNKKKTILFHELSRARVNGFAATCRMRN